MNARKIISRVMASLPVKATKEKLAAKIDLYRPVDISGQERVEWGAEKKKALDEWNADIPFLGSGSPITCRGGNLVSAPISTAAPTPLPYEEREQTDFPTL